MTRASQLVLERGYLYFMVSPGTYEWAKAALDVIVCHLISVEYSLLCVVVESSNMTQRGLKGVGSCQLLYT